MLTMPASGSRVRPWWSSLAVKLFASYLVVVLVGIAALLLAASLATPSFFDLRMAQMMSAPDATMMGRGGMDLGNPAMSALVDAALADAFRTALGQGLLVASAAAVICAIAASLLVSRRIAVPIHELAGASYRIAHGQYAERVSASGSDELGELGSSFNAMAAALEATEQRRSELIGDVAHELRTPLATLRGYLEGLRDGVVDPSEQTWARLHEETGRLQRLVDDLQELSRAEARQLSLQPRRLGLVELVHTAVKRVEAAYADKGVALETDVPPGLADAYADGDRAMQVLSNLLANALRYTDAGRTVRIAAVPASLGQVALSVSDTGAGIPAEHLPRIFDRFYRVDKSRTRALGGSGVGLTIARALVEAMGGRIWAASPGVGRGASFTFTLPVAM
jgi:signal transduction histidine kinase